MLLRALDRGPNVRVFHNGGVCSKQRKWEKVGHSMGDLIIKALRLRKREDN